MADAMEMMILSILAPALHCDWLLNEWQKALITTVLIKYSIAFSYKFLICDLSKVVFCGMMLSGAIWGKLCDFYGRKAVCDQYTN